MSTKETKKWIVVANLLCVVLMFGTYVFYPHYSADDYNNYYCMNYIGAAHSYLSMRPIVGIVCWVLAKLGMNFVRDQVFFGILLLLSIILLTTKLTFLISEKMNIKDIKSIVLLNLGSLLLMGNAFTSEYFWYASAYVPWIISIIGLALSITYFSKEENLMKNSLFSFVWLFIAVGSYQIIAIQYVAIVLFIVYIEQNKKINKTTLIILSRAGLILIVAMVCNMIISKPIGIMLGYTGGGATRLNFDFNLVSSIVHDYIVKAQPAIWIECMGTLPQTSMLIVFVLLMAACTVCSKNTALNLIWATVICIVVEGMICMIQILQGGFWPTLRTYVPIFSIFSILIWMNVYDKQCIEKMKIIFIISIVFLILNYIEIQVNTIDVIKTNTIDKEYARQIDARIQSYEDSSGIQVTKIGFVSDAYRLSKYESVVTNYIVGDLCERAFATSWSDCNSIRYYTGRELERVDVPEPYASQFSSRDWTMMQLDEQLVFDNDAVYIAVY